MAVRKPLVSVAGKVQQMPSGDAVPITSGGTGKATLGDAQASLGDLSAVTEAALNGTEQIGVWKAGFLRTSLAAIKDWLAAQDFTWGGAHSFDRGATQTNVSAGGSGARGNFSTVNHSAAANADGVVVGTLSAISNTACANSAEKRIALISFSSRGASDGNRGGSVALLAKEDGATSLVTRLSVNSSGAECSGTLTTAGVSTLSGGVKLGELSPTIKCKVVEGTVSATAGATTNIAHGLASADVIIGVTAAVQFSTSPSKWVAPHTFYSDSMFAFLWDGTNLAVTTHATASAVVLGKKVRFTILYTA